MMCPHLCYINGQKDLLELVGSGFDRPHWYLKWLISVRSKKLRLKTANWSSNNLYCLILYINVVFFVLVNNMLLYFLSKKKTTQQA